MAKKKAVKPGKRNEETAGKTRVELRFDSEVYEGIKGLADRAEISVNQLMHGLARWASEKLWVGEPVRDEQGNISHNPSQKGCLWAGETAARCSYSAEDKKKIQEEYADEPEIVPHILSEGYIDPHQRGKIYIRLDFTERRVVRED